MSLLGMYGRWQAGNSWDNVVFGDLRTGWFAQFSNFSAGMGDTVSLGLTDRIRGWVGYNDIVDRGSGFYVAGQVAGMAVNVGLSFTNPCALTSGFGTALRALNGVQAVAGAVNYVDNMRQGNYGMAALDALGVLGNLSQLSRVCFTGDTKLYARGEWGCGWRRIDQLTTQDEVLSRPEGEPATTPQWKGVEELFQRFGFVLHLHVLGRGIKTTGEHPFYVQGKGWVPAAQLRPGDLLSSHDGQWVPVAEVYDTGEYQAVYNLRVQDYHTYFVGSEEWALPGQCCKKEFPGVEVFKPGTL